MKIGILTHPQAANYGGILQCYALCTYLRKMGHEPIVIQRVDDKAFFLWEWTRGLLKALHCPRYYTPNRVDRTVNIRPFVKKHLVRTEPIDSQKKMRRVCQKYGLEAVIVGSDQVWRKSYAMRFGYNYFLDFVPDNIIKASYAASLGLSKWEYSCEQTEKIKHLLSRFIGISVREEDAVALLKNNVGVDTIQLLDPTMLLTDDDYNKITSHRLVNDDYVFVYWLGAKEAIADRIATMKAEGTKIVELYLKDHQEQISVEDWLSYIKYSSKVITDSFHGTVFSILFGRDFEILENESGGVGRISSLCKTLNINEPTEKNTSDIYSKLNILRKDSTKYLNAILMGNEIL